MPVTHKRLAAEVEAMECAGASKRPVPPRVPRRAAPECGLAPRHLVRSALRKAEAESYGGGDVLPSPTGSVAAFYAMEAEIGRGHFGVVRACTDRATGARLACKSLAKRCMASWEEKEDIRREIAIMQRVSAHENVVNLRAIFEDASHVHLVMERCEGGELFDLINQKGRFTESQAADIFRQLAEVISFCHAQGVMHRDLKPENILLSRKWKGGEAEPCCFTSQEGNLSSSSEFERVFGRGCACPSCKPHVKLADFGLALFLGPEQTAQGLAGSPLYLAPEVLRGSYGHTADVWSLGVILYILLCGSAPFCGETDMETLKAIEVGHIDFSHPLWKGVSSEAIDLIRWMLDLDANRRPTAAQVLHHPWLLNHFPDLLLAALPASTTGCHLAAQQAAMEMAALGISTASLPSPLPPMAPLSPPSPYALSFQPPTTYPFTFDTAQDHSLSAEAMQMLAPVFAPAIPIPAFTSSETANFMAQAGLLENGGHGLDLEMSLLAELSLRKACEPSSKTEAKQDFGSPNTGSSPRTPLDFLDWVNHGSSSSSPTLWDELVASEILAQF